MSRILFLILLALSGCARNIEEIAIASHEAYDRGDTQRAIAILESANAPTNYLIAPSLAFYYVAQGIAENKVANIERADLILQEVVLPEENRDFARLNITFLRFLAEGNTSKKRARQGFMGRLLRERE